MEITNKEAILAIMIKYGAQDARHIAMDAKRVLGVDLSPAQVSGILRPMVARGQVGCSNCGAGGTHYWLIKQEEESKA